VSYCVKDDKFYDNSFLKVFLLGRQPADNKQPFLKIFGQSDLSIIKYFLYKVQT
jgi:hypothetical protein